MDVRSYLASTRFAVIATAIAVAIPTNYLVFALTANSSLAFLGMFTLGVSTPQVYSRAWPVAYDRLQGVAWSVAACAVALGVLLGAFVVVDLVFDGFAAAVGAFLVVQLSISATTRAIERDGSLAPGVDPDPEG